MRNATSTPSSRILDARNELIDALVSRQGAKMAKETAPLRVELRTFRFVFLLDQMNDLYNSRLR